ncbi:uncharacterized protein L203_102143 [Cryptococcus depauperatus CBS 7841]|uniref:GTPase activating protein n=1 Tax=Cryptococcus depauperatus CBS 7841 TaxID=1295531 RepID=A0AAJ8M0F0_9TREE
MAPVTLPPTFYNSFWSPDYRTGLEVLFKNLEQGCLENNDVTVFIESQARAHHNLAIALLNPPSPSTSPESSSSLSHTLLSLRGASSARGEAHQKLAQELEERLLLGWKSWAERHEVRIKETRADILGKHGSVVIWEKDVHKLEQLKKNYLTKTRAADDSEDDAKFAPASARSPPLDPYTHSPKPLPSKQGNNNNLRRNGTVADRISEKLRAASTSSDSVSSSIKHQNTISVDGKVLPAPPSPLKSEDLDSSNLASPTSPREERFIPPTDPLGKPYVHGSDPVHSHASQSSLDQSQPLLISGLSLTPVQIKDILHRLDAYLLTTPAPNSEPPSTLSTKSNAALASRQRSTILGTYEKTVSGEELVNWLVENLEGLGGDWERCKDAAGELHKLGYFSRTGVGRGFDAGEDTYFVLKSNPHQNVTHLPSLNFHTPLSPSSINTNNIPSIFKQYQSYLPASLSNTDEPQHVRLRREANKAEEAYRDAVWGAEERRLELEEHIERGLRLWERWERERLAAVKAVLKQYEVALSRLPHALAKLQQPTTLSVEAFNPEADLKALIEGNRTGPFRPTPHVYESLEVDLPDVNFGIDLRKWSGDRGWKSLVNAPKREKGAIPEVLEAMLAAVVEMYRGIPEEERRRAWIYEVPLTETHMLRNAINNPKIPLIDIKAIVQKFNVPVAVNAIKLWFLELNPPVMGWEGWEDAKAVYPAIGADQEVDVRSAVGSVLGRLSGIQVFVLNAFIKHLRNMIDETKSAEADEVYITKLALSVGRTILRPQFETDLTIGDRTPSLFLSTIITHYSTLLPSLNEKLLKETDRPMPVKKRTALVDQRISRSSLGADHDLSELLELQKERIRAVSPAPRHKELPLIQPQTPSPSSAVVPAPLISTSQSTNPVSALGLDAPITDSKQEDHAAGSDEDEPFVPPTSVGAPANVPSSATQRSSILSTHSTKSDDKHSVPADYVSASAPKEDVKENDTVVASPAGGLKRGISGDTSRLRGPRAARGPRPVPGHRTANSSVSNENTRPDSPVRASSPTGDAGLKKAGSRPGTPGGSDRPTSRYGHSNRGSVSAAIAKFEKRDE